MSSKMLQFFCCRSGTNKLSIDYMVKVSTTQLQYPTRFEKSGRKNHLFARLRSDAETEYDETYLYLMHRRMDSK